MYQIKDFQSYTHFQKNYLKTVSKQIVNIYHVHLISFTYWTWNDIVYWSSYKSYSGNPNWIVENLYMKKCQKTILKSNNCTWSVYQRPQKWSELVLVAQWRIHCWFFGLKKERKKISLKHKSIDGALKKKT